ncbi:DHS-like NAD/FAD-binding domain-containing protein [Tricharina praecox]|uniref:DHS-like NAD/FAD-binding domain-containing protein n=1 Tax=Tricharina praecox TaxID=43433 RepID=UPI0022207B4B|nr:DHS-like NAD/FAD-binding domain-containing protein [Tricharina praecox]KAI5850989.1 DHS-like NAD/FAD-binding domain-containing protein [Tricharina praecox]
MPIITVAPDCARQLQLIADAIARSKKVVVVTGAGISTNCGIPDFRSADGLYNLVKAQYPNAVVKGRDLFDAVLWTDPGSTALFYTFLANLRNEVLNVKDTSSVHKLIKTLADAGRLLRCYTQNIDGLEEREGLVSSLSYGKGKRKRPSPLTEEDNRTDREKGCQVVQLHGNLKTLRCTNCHLLAEYSESSVQTLLSGEAPPCMACTVASNCRQAAGKRATRIGLLRPNVVLYGEEHPDGDMVGALTEGDLGAKPDIMLILGTSLKVHGLKRIVKEFAAAIHARNGIVVFINNTAPSESVWNEVIDYYVSMDCDSWVADVRVKRPGIWERQSKLSIRKVTKITEGDKENVQAQRRVLEPKTPKKKAKKALAPSKVFGAETPYISPPPSRKRGGKKNDYNAAPSLMESDVHRTPIKRQQLDGNVLSPTISPPETPSLVGRMTNITIVTPARRGSPKKNQVEVFEDADSMPVPDTPSKHGRRAAVGTERGIKAVEKMPEIEPGFKTPSKRASRIAVKTEHDIKAMVEMSEGKPEPKTPSKRGLWAKSAIELQIQAESKQADEAEFKNGLPKTATPRKVAPKQATLEIGPGVPALPVEATPPRRSLRNIKVTYEPLKG